MNICAALGETMRPFFRVCGLAAVLLSTLLLAGCQTDLYTNLEEKQANEIVATLVRNYIPAERVSIKGNLFAVRVEEKRFAEAVNILKEAGLPRERFANIGEVFKRDGLFASPVQEKASMIYALSQELSRSVSEIEGVVRARVHLVLPENDPLRQQSTPSSASVIVHYDSAAPVSNFVPQIKMVVANGVSGLTYDKVSVALFPVEVKKLAPGAEREMVSILGIWVHSDSMGSLIMLLLVFVAVIGGLGGGLYYIHRRSSKRVYQLRAIPDAKQS